jgi:hypothetical protein
MLVLRCCSFVYLSAACADVPDATRECADRFIVVRRWAGPHPMMIVREAPPAAQTQFLFISALAVRAALHSERVPSVAGRGVGAVGLGRVCESAKHSVAEKFVLLSMAPRRVWRPSDNLPVDDDLLRPELFSRQINLGTVWKPIPVVVADLGPVDVYLPKDQVTTEQILNH